MAKAISDLHETIKIAKAISNLHETIKIAAAAHRALKNGHNVQTVAALPVLKSGSGYGWTIESCALSWCDRETERAVKEVFRTFPEEVRDSMAFVPKAGEFCDRVRYWQDALRPALTRSQYYEAMRAIYGSYKRVKWVRKCPERLIAFETAWNEFTHSNDSVYDPAEYERLKEMTDRQRAYSQVQFVGRQTQ